MQSGHTSNHLATLWLDAEARVSLSLCGNSIQGDCAQRRVVEAANDVIVTDFAMQWMSSALRAARDRRSTGQCPVAGQALAIWRPAPTAGRTLPSRTWLTPTGSFTTRSRHRGDIWPHRAYRYLAHRAYQSDLGGRLTPGLCNRWLAQAGAVRSAAPLSDVVTA